MSAPQEPGPQEPAPQGAVPDEAALDRRIVAVLVWVVAMIAACDALAAHLGLKYLQEVEWPSDLYAFEKLADVAPVDVAIVGSSRAHYGLPPSALDACLGPLLGRTTRTVGLNRLTASAYAEDLVARDLLVQPPKVLIVELAPETLNAAHFELDYNLKSTANLVDIPECLGAARSPERVVSCVRPVLRGVENIAHLIDRPLSDHAHISWMMQYEGGGQYCFDAPECVARNADYDARHAGRWAERMRSLIPEIRAGRFGVYQIREGLPAAHFRALVTRARAAGTRVVAINLPVSAAYQAEIPATDYATFLDVVDGLSGALHFRFVDMNTPEWQAARPLFLDPDHLDGEGAARLAHDVCTEVLQPLLRD